MISEQDTSIETMLQSQLPMPAADSAVGIIVVDGSKYMMQLRDQKPTIYYPGHWGLFGGAVDDGESPERTVRRELDEELGFRTAEIAFLTEFTFDLSFIGEPKIYRRYYEVNVTQAAADNFRLTEGRAMQAFRPEALFNLRLTPYDSFALWLHYLKKRGPAPAR
jgi:8-oxo-dGTP pyrophosphatase MutT (NUDIX family)